MGSGLPWVRVRVRVWVRFGLSERVRLVALPLACLALARLAQVEPELAGALCAPRRRRASRSVVAAPASPRDAQLAVPLGVQGQIEGSEPMPKTRWHT